MMTFFRTRSPVWPLFLAVLAVLFVDTVFVQPASALKFEIPARPAAEAKRNELCIGHRASFEQLVIVTAIITGGTPNDGQQALGMTVTDVFGNNHGSFKDGFGEKRILFNARGEGDFYGCFQNVLLRGPEGPSRMIEFDVDIGSNAKDWRAIQADNKLKPIEVDLRRAEELLDDITGDMERLRQRELRLRDTNESTHERMKWFNFILTATMIVLVVGQMLFLNNLFKRAHMN